MSSFASRYGKLTELCHRVLLCQDGLVADGTNRYYFFTKLGVHVETGSGQEARLLYCLILSLKGYSFLLTAWYKETKYSKPHQPFCKVRKNVVVLRKRNLRAEKMVHSSWATVFGYISSWNFTQMLYTQDVGFSSTSKGKESLTPFGKGVSDYHYYVKQQRGGWSRRDTASLLILAFKFSGNHPCTTDSW